MAQDHFQTPPEPKKALNQKKIQSKNFSFVDYMDEKIIINPIDYYYSNVIARASKTMSECRSIKTDLKKTGTEG